jgi:hypothetical protein
MPPADAGGPEADGALTWRWPGRPRQTGPYMALATRANFR